MNRIVLPNLHPVFDIGSWYSETPDWEVTESIPIKDMNWYLSSNLVTFPTSAKNKAVENSPKPELKLLCDYAKEHGVTELYDDFEIDRNGIKIFEDLGFKTVNKYNAKRFGKDIEIVVVKKVL